MITTIDEAKSVATSLGRCTLLPDGIRNSDDAFMIVMTGAELGLGPMASIRNLHIIKGKVTMSAELMLARLLAQDVTSEWVTATNEEAELLLTRPDSKPHRETFTMADARRAQLVKSGGNWDKYPKAMLRARCISAAARAYAPDLMAGGGVYTPDELEVIDVEEQPRQLSAVQEDVRADNPAAFDAAMVEADSQKAAAEFWYEGQRVELDRMAAIGKALASAKPGDDEARDAHLGEVASLHEDLSAWIRAHAFDYRSHNNAAGKGALSKARGRLMHAATACGVVGEMNDMIRAAAQAIEDDNENGESE